MEIMDKGTHCTKKGLIVQPKIPEMPQNLSVQFVCQPRKFSILMKKGFTGRPQSVGNNNEKCCKILLTKSASWEIKKVLSTAGFNLNVYSFFIAVSATETFFCSFCFIPQSYVKICKKKERKLNCVIYLLKISLTLKRQSQCLNSLKISR